MQRYSQSFRSFRSNSLAYIFLTANFAACALILDWKEFFSYIAKMDAKECKPPVSEKISFGMYHFYGSSELASFLTLLLLLFVVLILAFLFLPSLAAALSVVGGLKIDYPEWCPETFDFIRALPHHEKRRTHKTTDTALHQPRLGDRPDAPQSF